MLDLLDYDPAGDRTDRHSWPPDADRHELGGL